jgi:predicted O-methyltransferase YrrM
MTTLVLSVLSVLIVLLAALIIAYGVYLRRSQRLALNAVRALLSRSFENHFRQLEALVGIHLDLVLKKSLPPTRAWAASPDFLREIELHALHARPKVIVECGSGVSTVILARCMQLNEAGHVYSLEHLPEFADKTRWDLRRHGLEDWASVLTAPLRRYELRGETVIWYSFEKLPQIEIDMLLVDGPPEETGKLARFPAALLFDRLKPGGVVFLDDANRDDEKTALRLWAQEFTDFRQERRNCETGCAVLWKPPAARVPAAAAELFVPSLMMQASALLAAV